MHSRLKNAYSNFHNSPARVAPIENTACQLVGSKVLIQTHDGDYQGTVTHVWGNMEKLSLSKVTAMPSQKRFVGVHNFFKPDIKNITILEKTSNMKDKKTRDLESKPGVQLRPLPFGSISQEKDINYSDSDADEPTTEVPDVIDEDPRNFSKKGDISWKDYGNEEGSAPQNLKLPLPTKYIILDEVNEEFHDSIKDIESSSLVGFAMECNKGRLGEIILLCVSTEAFVYLFDVMTLGATTFDRGLRAILESSEIIKVVHDCRLLSDALFHISKVTLTNVFDTQVGDVVLHIKDNQNSLPQYVDSLSQCLRKYISLDPKFIPKPNQNNEELQNIYSQWKIRPLPPFFREIAIRSVIFLKELRQAIMDKLLADLNLGTQIYLNAVRKASPEELALNLGAPHVLPPAMSCLSSREMKYLHHSEYACNMMSADNIWIKDESEKKQPIKQNESKSLSQPVVSGRNVNHELRQHSTKNNVFCNTHSKETKMVPEQKIRTKGLAVLNGNHRSSSLCNSTFEEDMKNVRWVSNGYPSIPKGKCIPSGVMYKGPSSKKQTEY